MRHHVRTRQRHRAIAPAQLDTATCVHRACGRGRARQHVATRCTMLQLGARCCNSVHDVATRCTMLQHGARCCNTGRAPFGHGHVGCDRLCQDFRCAVCPAGLRPRATSRTHTQTSRTHARIPAHMHTSAICVTHIGTLLADAVPHSDGGEALHGDRRRRNACRRTRRVRTRSRHPLLLLPSHRAPPGSHAFHALCAAAGRGPRVLSKRVLSGSVTGYSVRGYSAARRSSAAAGCGSHARGHAPEPLRRVHTCATAAAPTAAAAGIRHLKRLWLWLTGWAHLGEGSGKEGRAGAGGRGAQGSLSAGCTAVSVGGGGVQRRRGA
jgi:hypothetical protein